MSMVPPDTLDHRAFARVKVEIGRCEVLRGEEGGVSLAGGPGGGVMPGWCGSGIGGRG